MWIRISKYYQFAFIKNTLVKYQVHGNKFSKNIEEKIKRELNLDIRNWEEVLEDFLSILSLQRKGGNL